MNIPIVQATWPGASLLDAQKAITQCAATQEAWRDLTDTERAELLTGLAKDLRQNAQQLAEVAHRETHLTLQRLVGEVERTAAQLELFAAMVESGGVHGCVLSPAVESSGGKPRQPDLRRMNIPLDGVALIFAASNFPLAFSVLGGDCASALAAGCPVLVKCHPGHPKTSFLTAQIAHDVLRLHNLPTALISLVETNNEVAVSLVKHNLTAAVGFTGSLRAGRLLADVTAARPVPIPFFGELGSVNPVVVLPDAAAHKMQDIVDQLCSSITLGVGQFCTRPGVVFVPHTASGEAVVLALRNALAKVPPGVMLYEGLRQGFQKRVRELLASEKVLPELLATSWHQTEPADQSSDFVVSPVLMSTQAKHFLQEETLREETFGPLVLVVYYCDAADIEQCLQAVGGALTATLCMTDGDMPMVKKLTPTLQKNCWTSFVRRHANRCDRERCTNPRRTLPGVQPPRKHLCG